MDFQHSSEIWRDFPELVPGVVYRRRGTERHVVHDAGRHRAQPVRTAVHVPGVTTRAARLRRLAVEHGIVELPL
jgi:hypothetical protein